MTPRHLKPAIHPRRGASIDESDCLAIITRGQPAQVGGVDAVADRADAAITKGELADARMPAAELARVDAVHDAGARRDVRRPLRQWVFDAGDAGREAAPGAVVDGSVADFCPGEHADRNVLFARQERR